MNPLTGSARGVIGSARGVVGTAIAIALVVIVQIVIGWTSVLAPWMTIPIRDLLLPTTLVLFSYLLRSLRITDWFNVPIGPATRIMLQHNLWNNLMPMRTGELSFPVLLKRHLDIEPTRSLVALAWFRVLDLLCLLTILLSAYGWLLGHPWLFGLLMAGLVMFLPLTHFIVTRTLPSLIGQESKLQVIVDALQMEQIKLWRCLLWSLTNWGVKLLAFALVFSLFAQVDLVTSLIASIGGELTSVLPIHGVGGAGTYEAGIVGLSLTVNMDYEPSLAAGVNLHLFLLSITLFTGLCSILLPRKSELKT
ncbi:MAG TPA: hypothetical protein DCM54_17195 [Gammaproteobacteria bacterium]|nr:hypothetical protein [Gammaproteobacteria bacterium]